MSKRDVEPLELHVNGAQNDHEVPVVESALISSGMRVTFKEVTYTVTNSGNKKEKIALLDAVSGWLEPGQLTALMGPSGSGKTTLLDVLAGRKTTGKIQGEILFSGHKASRMFLRRYSSYVEQFDTLIANLSVREMLLYTAELKNRQSMPYEDKVTRVESALRQLGLEGCKNVRIGSALNRGISGGQAKRVNIGLALVTNPRVLFLDEPTSGLDSFTANEVLTVIKGLTSLGISLCSTIHSPTPYCFSLFDTLTLLLRGRVIYCGPNGSAAIDYFEKQFPHIASYGGDGAYQNQAEWIVDLTTKADRDGRYLQFAEAYDNSRMKVLALEEVTRPSKEDDMTEEKLKELSVQRATTTSFFFGLKTLTKYRVLKDLKDPEYLAPRVAEKLIFALIVLTLYWKIGDDKKPTNVNNLTSVLFMWAVLPAYSAAAYIPSIVLERTLYVRERNDGLHRAITYLISKMTGEVVVTFFCSIVFSAMVFYTLKLSGDFVYFWIANLLTSLCGIALGYVFAAHSPNMEFANAALPLYVTVLLFFTGLLIRPLDQPVYWHWFAYIDFIHYSWSGMMINQFAGTTTVAYDNIPVLIFYSMEYSNKWEQIGWLCVFFVVFVAVAWVALAYKRLQKR